MEGTTAKFLQSVGDQRSNKNEVLVDAWLRFSLTKGQDLALKDKENIGEFLFNEASENHALIYIRLLTIYVESVIEDLDFPLTKVNSSRGFISLSSHLVRYIADLVDGKEKIIWTMTEFAQDELNPQINEQERKATFQATLKAALNLLNLLQSKELPILQEWQFLSIKLQLISGNFDKNEVKNKAIDLVRNCLESSKNVLDLMLIKSLLIVIEIFSPKDESLPNLWSLFCQKLFKDEDESKGTLEPEDMIHYLPSIKSDSTWRHRLDYVVKKPSSYQEAGIILVNLQVSNANIELLKMMSDFDRLRSDLDKLKKWKRQCKWHRRRFNKATCPVSKATTCLDMLDSLNKIFEDQPKNNKIVQKMTFYAKTGIDGIEKAIQKYPDNDYYHFLLAQLYSKFFTPSVPDQMNHTQKAIDAYQKVLELSEIPALLMKSKDAKDLLERQLKTHRKQSEPQK